MRERVEVAGAQPPKAGDLLSFFGCAAFAEEAVARYQIHFYDEIEAVFIVDGGVRGGNLPAELGVAIRAQRVETAVEFDVLRCFGQRRKSAVFVGDEVDVCVVHIGVRALGQHRQQAAQQPQKRIFRRRGRGRQHKSRVFLAFLRLLKRMRFEKSVFESDFFPRKAQRKKVREAVEPVIELLAPSAETPRPNPQQLPAQPRGHRARYPHFAPLGRFGGGFVEEVLEVFDEEILVFLFLEGKKGKITCIFLKIYYLLIMKLFSSPRKIPSNLDLIKSNGALVPVCSRGFRIYQRNFGQLISPENIAGKRVLEIGGGGSDALRRIREMGAQSVLGIDLIYKDGVDQILLNKSQEIVKTLSDQVRQCKQEIALLNQNDSETKIRTKILKKLASAWKHHVLSILIDQQLRFVRNSHSPLQSWAEDFTKNPKSYLPRALPNIELESGTFDLVVSHWCFPHHFPTPEVFWPALDEILRITAPSGRVILYPFQVEAYQESLIKFEETGYDYLKKRGFRLQERYQCFPKLNRTLIFDRIE